MTFFTELERNTYKKMGVLRKIKFLIGTLKRNLIVKIQSNVSFLKIIQETKDSNNPINFKYVIKKIFRINKGIYWPIHSSSEVNFPQNIIIGIDTSPGYAPGCYIQGIGKIFIGDYTGIAPNVGIISANHSLLDFRDHQKGVVEIGKYCWIGMGAVILPNVTLGDFTTVRPNSVVDKSFERGYCVIGGNPAKIIKEFPEESFHLFNQYEHEKKYNGYIPSDQFEEFRKKNLNV